MLREITTVSLLVGYSFLGEFALNELMWSKVRANVKKFGKLKQQEYMNLNSSVVIEAKDRLSLSSEQDLINEE